MITPGVQKHCKFGVILTPQMRSLLFLHSERRCADLTKNILTLSPNDSRFESIDFRFEVDGDALMLLPHSERKKPAVSFERVAWCD